ncbi:sulfurtransferase [Hahella sp. CCB-MM4]|uniref:rhodanese-like domain-containing protein n=1 Tax=Hahella sp. (strain CCB-MM4) TaxID=1926491 RepID=UPI000B9B4A88|nr:rhodanese-like domain-containing protein [Hahella sp. CCB-MM4]OZG71853.1 sulfurtransferase [Hahella sp. CCB-MM4]
MEKFLFFAMDHWILSSLFVALLVALLLTERKRGGKAVTPQQAVMLLNKEQAVVVDVRDKKETSEGVIRGSILIPFSSLKDRASELEKHKEKIIIVADKMGQHSSMAVRTLSGAGFSNVQRLSGGVVEWKNANLPLAKK